MNTNHNSKWMTKMNYKLTKRACYFSYIAASSVFSLPPLLFQTFHQTYGISYTLLGTLVLINFCSQLIIDLIFTFFSKHFNIKRTVQIMPLLLIIFLFSCSFSPLSIRHTAIFTVECPHLSFFG